MKTDSPEAAVITKTYSQRRAEALQRLTARRDMEAGDRWGDVMDVVAILQPLPQRTPQYAQAQTEIAEARWMQRRTQQYCVQIWRACCDPRTGEPMLPVRLHWSVAILLAQKGADHKVFMRANDECWTRKRVRAWAQGRELVSERSRRLWPHVTAAVPRVLRTLEGEPTAEQAGDIVLAVRQALRTFGREKAPVNQSG